MNNLKIKQSKISQYFSIVSRNKPSQGGANQSLPSVSKNVTDPSSEIMESSSEDYSSDNSSEIVHVSAPDDSSSEESVQIVTPSPDARSESVISTSSSSDQPSDTNSEINDDVSDTNTEVKNVDESDTNLGTNDDVSDTNAEVKNVDASDTKAEVQKVDVADTTTRTTIAKIVVEEETDKVYGIKVDILNAPTKVSTKVKMNKEDYALMKLDKYIECCSNKVERTACIPCDFCGLYIKDEVQYGEFHSRDEENIHAHDYCLLFSSSLNQRGEDHEGINGFLFEDIRRELDKNKDKVCCYCKRKGACVVCAEKQCRKIYHYPCNVKNKGRSQYFQYFRTFCLQHLPKVYIPVAAKINCNGTCVICLENIKPDNTGITALYLTCCKKNWVHRDCMMRYALNAGLHFCKCPSCNNHNVFQQCIRKYGIYLPDRDASWERDGMFNDQITRRTCDVEECKSDDRTKDIAGTEWEIIMCITCGAKGTHIECQNSDLDDDIKWLCSDCDKIDLSHKIAEILTPSPRKFSPIKDFPSPTITSSTNRKRKLNMDEGETSSDTSSVPSTSGILSCKRTRAGEVLKITISSSDEEVDVLADGDAEEYSSDDSARYGCFQVDSDS